MAIFLSSYMINQSISEIKSQISNFSKLANRNDNEISLLAISKTFSSELVEEAFNSGIPDFGENYVQELLDKKTKLQHLKINWHFVGHLQSNKVKFIAPFVEMLHSVDSKKIAEEIDFRAKKENRKIKILIEVNTSDEKSKFGVKPNCAINFISEISHLKNIQINGLMTIGPFTDNPENSRPAFKKLRALMDEANNLKLTTEPLIHLSMGMSHDFKIAIEEGATILRIGTAIFGKRTKKDV